VNPAKVQNITSDDVDFVRCVAKSITETFKMFHKEKVRKHDRALLVVSAMGTSVRNKTPGSHIVCRTKMFMSINDVISVVNTHMIIDNLADTDVSISVDPFEAMRDAQTLTRVIVSKFLVNIMCGQDSVCDICKCNSYQEFCPCHTLLTPEAVKNSNLIRLMEDCPNNLTDLKNRYVNFLCNYGGNNPFSSLADYGEEDKEKVDTVIFYDAQCDETKKDVVLKQVPIPNVVDYSPGALAPIPDESSSWTQYGIVAGVIAGTLVLASAVFGFMPWPRSNEVKPAVRGRRWVNAEDMVAKDKDELEGDKNRRIKATNPLNKEKRFYIHTGGSGIDDDLIHRELAEESKKDYVAMHYGWDQAESAPTKKKNELYGPLLEGPGYIPEYGYETVKSNTYRITTPTCPTWYTYGLRYKNLCIVDKHCFTPEFGYKVVGPCDLYLTNLHATAQKIKFNADKLINIKDSPFRENGDPIDTLCAFKVSYSTRSPNITLATIDGTPEAVMVLPRLKNEVMAFHGTHGYCAVNGRFQGSTQKGDCGLGVWSTSVTGEQLVACYGIHYLYQDNICTFHTFDQQTVDKLNQISLN